jgi:hypothetical protein
MYLFGVMDRAVRIIVAKFGMEWNVQKSTPESMFLASSNCLYMSI